MDPVAQNRHNRVDRISRLIQSPRAHIRQLVGMLHPTELADVLEACDEDTQERIVRQLPGDLISQALAEMDDETRPGELLQRLHPRAAAGLIKELDPDDATDLLAQIDEPYKERILYHLPDEEEAVINRLLSYDKDSAGGLMNPELVAVRAEMSLQEAVRVVARESEDQEDFYVIYVLDQAGRLVGYLTLRSLFHNPRHKLVAEVMEREIVSVPVNMDQEDVAKLMSQYNLPTLPVVDKERMLIGRITFDDILDVMEEETTEDILSFAGVSDDQLKGGWFNSVKSRIPWLLINLGTATAAATVLSLFSDIQQKMVALVAFMPVIAGVAGNGATQTLAVTIRRISTDGIPRQLAMQVILKEVITGAINGLILGVLSSVIAVAFNENPLIGVVVFFAMLGNLLIAGLMGSFVPIFLERKGVDPAIASSILITAFTDILGYTLLFGLGTIILM